MLPLENFTKKPHAFLYQGHLLGAMWISRIFSFFTELNPWKITKIGNLRILVYAM